MCFRTRNACVAGARDNSTRPAPEQAGVAAAFRGGRLYLL